VLRVLWDQIKTSFHLQVRLMFVTKPERTLSSPGRRSAPRGYERCSLVCACNQSFLGFYSSYICYRHHFLCFGRLDYISVPVGCSSSWEQTGIPCVYTITWHPHVCMCVGPVCVLGPACENVPRALLHLYLHTMTRANVSVSSTAGTSTAGTMKTTEGEIAAFGRRRKG